MKITEKEHIISKVMKRENPATKTPDIRILSVE